MDKKNDRSRVWRPKRNDREGDDNQESAADVSMVFILVMEFMAPTDRYDMSEREEQMAQLVLEPMMATFEKPEDEKWQHLKALFLKGHVNGRPITRLLVD